MFHILNWVFGCIAYCIAGCVLGLGINKKALLHAFVMIAILGLMATLILESWSLWAVLKLISKLFCYLLGCALVLSKKI